MLLSRITEKEKKTTYEYASTYLAEFFYYEWQGISSFYEHSQS